MVVSFVLILQGNVGKAVGGDMGKAGSGSNLDTVSHSSTGCSFQNKFHWGKHSEGGVLWERILNCFLLSIFSP